MEGEHKSYNIYYISNKTHVLLLVIISNIFLGSCSVIIPEELPSLLSVAYSNIPPIKKGTDSRVGFGYAFGNHADFQVMFEFGPQTNTNPIGQSFAANAKRQAPNHIKINKNKEKFYQTDAGKHLLNWAEKMQSLPQENSDTARPKPGDVPNLEDSVVELIKNSKGEFEIRQPAPLPGNVMDQLKQLYEKKDQVNAGQKLVLQKENTRSKEEIKKITEDLSNVDLD